MNEVIIPETAPLTNCQQLAVDLRAAADLIERLPSASTVNPQGVYLWFDEKDDIARCARVFGQCEKKFDDLTANLVKQVGGIPIQCRIWRDRVCTKTVIEEEVPEMIIPAREETVVPAHIKKTTMWDCPESLLSEVKT